MCHSLAGSNSSKEHSGWMSDWSARPESWEASLWCILLVEKVGRWSVSQELPGINILANAQGTLYFGFCSRTKSSSMKSRTEASSQLEPEPQFSQMLVWGWSGPAFQEWHMSARGVPGLCLTAGWACHILHLVKILSFWATGQRCCWFRVKMHHQVYYLTLRRHIREESGCSL